MNKTKRTMRWTTAAVLAVVIGLPGLALAHGHDDDDGYRDGRREWRHEGKQDHWRHYKHGRLDSGRRVVVVREPVYVEPPVRVVAPVLPPLWGGITVVFSPRL